MIKDTNPDHYKVEGANFIEYMNDPKISGFGNWMFTNGFNSGFSSGVWASTNWISVKDRLPEEHESIFYKFLGTRKWSNSMWKQESEKVLVYVSFPDGTGVVTTGCLHNSDWVTTVSKTLPQTVTHWMPFPEPPEVKQDG